MTDALAARLAELVEVRRSQAKGSKGERRRRTCRAPGCSQVMVLTDSEHRRRPYCSGSCRDRDRGTKRCATCGTVITGWARKLAKPVYCTQGCWDDRRRS